MVSRIGFICGGSGSSKFVLAFSRYIGSVGANAKNLTFVANVADNFWHEGVYVCPDVDIVTLALAGLLDEKKGWGIASDSFSVKTSFDSVSSSSGWFNLGDHDLGLCLKRTQLTRSGWSLSSITRLFCGALAIRQEISPSTDAKVQTYVRTRAGWMHLQEYWVKHGAAKLPIDVEYRGLGKAHPCDGVLESLEQTVIICPANPITSILPTVRLSGVANSLSRAKVVAISPFIGNRPFSGPARELMHATGNEATSLGVARLYSKFLKLMIVDESESPEELRKIRDEGIECVSTNTRIVNASEGASFAKVVLEIL